jgi:hypothetical protein
MQLLEKSKEEITKLLCEDIQGICSKVLLTLNGLSKVEGKDLESLYELMNLCKVSREGALNIIKEVNDRNSKKSN